MTPKKVAVGFPLYKQIPAPVFTRWLGMDKTPVVATCVVDAVYLPKALGIIVGQALDLPGWERLVIFEQDMIPPHDAFSRVAAHGGDIVGAVYVGHVKPHEPMVYLEVEGEFHAVKPDVIAEWVEEPGLYEVHAVGCGFLSIARNVLEDWDPAVPMWKTDDEHFGSQDLWFCHHARKQGFKIFVDSGMVCGHLSYDETTLTHAVAATPPSAPRVLNVGGGSKTIALPARYDGWEHVLLDVVPGPDVDIVADARKLATEVEADSFDAAYCSHAIEHFHEHEVAGVLEGFRHVLRPGGTVEIRCPDMGAITDALGAGADLDDEAYVSPAGPITYRDMIYGYGPEIATGNPWYAHKTGFTASRLMGALKEAGFSFVEVHAEEPFGLAAKATWKP